MQTRVVRDGSGKPHKNDKIATLGYMQSVQWDASRSLNDLVIDCEYPSIDINC